MEKDDRISEIIKKHAKRAGSRQNLSKSKSRYYLVRKMVSFSLPLASAVAYSWVFRLAGLQWLKTTNKIRNKGGSGLYAVFAAVKGRPVVGNVADPGVERGEGSEVGAVEGADAAPADADEEGDVVVALKLTKTLVHYQEGRRILRLTEWRPS